MKQYTSDQMLEEFGNMILFENHHLTSLFDQLKYISGFLPFNKFIYSDNYDENNHVIYFNKRAKGLEILIERGPFQCRTGLPFDDINYLAIESAEEIARNGKNSTTAKACRHGRLTGNMANAVMEMLEGMKPDSSDALNRYPDNLLILSYNTSLYNDDQYSKERFLLFGIKDKNLPFVKDFFSVLFKDKFANTQVLRTGTNIRRKKVNYHTV